MKQAILLALLCIHTPIVYADFINGNQLIQFKNDYVSFLQNQNAANFNHIGAGAYMSFINGVSDSSVRHGFLCYPYGATRLQSFAIVAKYLEDNPVMWNMPAVDLVNTALVMAFPCRKAR
jgi:hypothetical protein